MLKCFLSLFLALFAFKCNAEVLIITYAYNRPDFIELQCRTFEKLLKDDYRFVVFNDAVDRANFNAIQQICALWNVECVAIPQEIHDLPYLPREKNDPLHRPNIRHCNCIQYSLNTIGFKHNGPVAIVDSDIFLVRPFCVEELLKDVDIVAPIRGADNHVYYLWPGLTFLAMDRLPDRETMNFNCGNVNGSSVDSGGHTYTYLKSHPEVTIKNAVELFSYQLFCPDRFVPSHMIDTTTPREQQIQKFVRLGFNEKEIKFLLQKPHTINFALDNHFLHYRAGSNYDHQSQKYEAQKSDLIKSYIDDVLSDY